MLKLFKNKFIVLSLVGIMFISGFGIYNKAVEAASIEDPLITLSYFNKQLQALEQKILLKVQELLADLGELPSTEQGEEQVQPPTPPVEPEPEVKVPFWQVITLAAEEKLVAEAGCEIILRSGQAYAIASALGGLADLTAGSDLSTGQAVSLNHHILIPRSDGRGIRASEMSYLMVKGDYIIEK